MDRGLGAAPPPASVLAPPSSDPGIRGPQPLRPRIQESRPQPPPPSAPRALTPAPSSLGHPSPGPPAPPPSVPDVPPQPRLPQTQESGAPCSSALESRNPGPARLPRPQELRPQPPPPSDPRIPVQPGFLKPGSPGSPDPPPSDRGVRAPSSSALRPRSRGPQLLRLQTQESRPAPPPSAPVAPTPAHSLSVWVPALLTAATIRSCLQPQLAPVTGGDPSSSLTSCPETAPRLQEYPTPPPSCRAHPRPWA